MSESEDSALETHIHQFYWGLLATVYEKQLVDKTNLLVLWCHYNLVRRGMKNVGLGDDVSLPDQKDTQEALPDGWNDSLPCRMRYLHDKTLYLLTVHPADDDGDVIINLSRPLDNKIAVSGMNLNEIPKLKGKLEEVLPNWATIQDRLNKELIDPLLKNAASRDVQCQTEPAARSTAPPVLPANPFGIPSPLARPLTRDFFPDSPLGVGSSDLNPLGGGGGMLFEPPGMGMGPSFMPDPLLPRGAIPPGARFDPILPGPGRSYGRGRGGLPPPGRPGPSGSYPDPDHLPPPGYDDMFS